MGITGLIPFLEKASRKVNISEFSGCTVAIDSYCWLHKGAFACAEKLVRGENTDIHIKYCLKYVTMLLSKNIKPILVFDGQHLPAKAMTEAKRRESRNASKKRAAELLVMGKTDEARSYVRRSVDITHEMALELIKECRKRNVDCIVAPYEADAQLAYLNIKNYAHLVITEDSDLILFGCSKVLFKMDLDGSGILVEASKLPLAMRCPIEKYSFSKFRQMCVMSGCDYLSSLPGIGLVKARQFMNATHDPDIANALKKLPSFFNKSSLIVTDEYRESFLRAEATFKHQYVFDPLSRSMVRLNDIDDEDTELAFCSNAGEMLPPNVSLQLMLGNLDPFTLKQLDDWSPDFRVPLNHNLKTDSWKQTTFSTHPSIWSKDFEKHLKTEYPWKKQQVAKITEHIIKKPVTRPKKKVVSFVNVIVPETADESLSIENLSNMYCVEPITKRVKLNETDTQEMEIDHNIALTEHAISANLTQPKSPILANKYKDLKRLSSFPRTVLDANVVESKFFNAPIEISDSIIEDSQVKSPILTPKTRNPFKVKENNLPKQESPIDKDIDFDNVEVISDSQKENSPKKSPVSEGFCRGKGVRNLFGLEHKIQSFDSLSPDVIENTYPMESLITPVDSQNSFGESQPSPPKILLEEWKSKYDKPKQVVAALNPSKSISFARKPGCKVPGLKKSISLPHNQPTLLSKFGFQKRPAMKR